MPRPINWTVRQLLAIMPVNSGFVTRDLPLDKLPKGVKVHKHAMGGYIADMENMGLLRRVGRIKSHKGKSGAKISQWMVTERGRQAIGATGGE